MCCHWKACVNRCSRASTWEGGIDLDRFAIVRKETAADQARGRPNWPHRGS